MNEISFKVLLKSALVRSLFITCIIGCGNVDIFISITSISNVKAIQEIILSITSSHGIIADGTTVYKV